MPDGSLSGAKKFTLEGGYGPTPSSCSGFRLGRCLLGPEFVWVEELKQAGTIGHCVSECVLSWCWCCVCKVCR